MLVLLLPMLMFLGRILLVGLVCVTVFMCSSSTNHPRFMASILVAPPTLPLAAKLALLTTTTKQESLEGEGCPKGEGTSQKSHCSPLLEPKR